MRRPVRLSMRRSPGSAVRRPVLVAVVLITTLLAGCTDSEDNLDRADFVNDPIFSIEIDGAESEPILAAPIGSGVTNDRGYRAERFWDGVDDEAYRNLAADLVDADVAFHRIRCRESATNLDGTKALASGLVVSVNARHDHTTNSASIRVTGLDPDQEGVTPLRPPDSVDIDETCDIELRRAAGLS